MCSRNRILSPVLLASLLLTFVAASIPAQGVSPESALEEALAAVRAGEVARARELLEAVIDNWPGYRRAHYHLGRLEFDRGDLEEAARRLSIATQGDFPRAFSAWYHLGRTRMLQRDFSGAVEALDGALERAPGFSPALFERGRARLFMNDVDAGLADLSATLESPEAPPRAAVLTAQLLISLGRSQEARSVVQGLIDRSEREDPWRAQAQWLLEALDPGPSSQVQLAREVGGNPAAGDLYWALATTHLATDPGRSRLLFRIALDHDSENPISLRSLEQLVGESEAVALPTAMPNLRPALMRARKLWEEGSHQAGRRIAERLLAARPGLVPAHLLVARDAERLGELWRAAWIYEKLLEGLGPIPSIGRNLAQVAQAMGAPELASCGIELARKGEPSDGSLYYLLGVIEADRGETAAAIQAHERSLELGYRDVRTWLRLGELHFERMDISASLAAYERAMAIEPAAAEAVRSFALSSLTTEQYASLRDILEAHVLDHPEDINTLYSLGVMSLRDNRLDDAKDYFLRLARVAPDHRQVHYSLGQVLLRQGDTAEGQAEMERFRRIKAAEDQEWEEHNQAHFRRVEARKLVESGHPEDAIPLYTQSVSEGTAELTDYLELAAANLAAGRLAEALRGYEGVLSTYAFDRLALEGLLAAATEAGEQQKAEDAARKLATLDWPCMMTASDMRGNT